jgi:hypothetical protein
MNVMTPASHWGYRGGHDYDDVLLVLLPSSSALKMETGRLCETLASTNQSTGQRNPKEHDHTYATFFSSPLQILSSYFFSYKAVAIRMLEQGASGRT